MPVPAFLREPLAAYRERLRAIFGDRLRDVRLFGSYARGDAHEDSDVDVFVMVDGMTETERWNAAGAEAPIVVATGIALAPLLMSTEQFEELRRRERLLAKDIDGEGISL